MKLKKILLAILCGVFAVSACCFAACSNDGGKKNSDEAGGASVNGDLDDGYSDIY